MVAYPATVIPIVEAFDLAVRKLNPIATETLADLDSEDDPRNRVAWENADEQMRDVERRMRRGLASRELIPIIVNEDGSTAELIGDDQSRDAWLEESFGVPGFDATTHPVTNPGPQESRPIFIEKASFIRWFAKQGIAVTHTELDEYTLDSSEADDTDSLLAQKKNSETGPERGPKNLTKTLRERRRPGRPPAADWPTIKIEFFNECRRRGGIPSAEMEAGWKTITDGRKFVFEVLSDRREAAGDTAVADHTRDFIQAYQAEIGRK